MLTPQTLAEDEPREVKLGDLENEIAELGRNLSKTAEGAEAVTRSASLTLLVYVESPEAADKVGRLLCTVSQQNPCRAILLVSQPSAQPAELRAWISAQCASSAGGKRLEFEQIRLDARGDAVRDLGSAALPLTVADLPVYFWWRAGRFDPPAYFDQVLRVTHHVLVDSARFANPDSDLIALNQQVAKRAGHNSFLDLNWARITPWRELIAQCFDHPERRRYLDRVSRVRIEYESASPRLAAQTSQALLIAGWLATCLKWELGQRSATKQDGVWSSSIRSASGEVEIQRVAREFDGGGKGVCFSVTLEASGSPPASFRLERGADGRCVTTRAEIQGRPAVSRTVRLEVLGEAKLVNEELQFSSRDRIFEASLDVASRLLQT